MGTPKGGPAANAPELITEAAEIVMMRSLCFIDDTPLHNAKASLPLFELSSHDILRSS
jgi:hypothetical protein